MGAMRTLNLRLRMTDVTVRITATGWRHRRDVQGLKLMHVGQESVIYNESFQLVLNSWTDLMIFC